MICSALIKELIKRKNLVTFPENSLNITLESRLDEGIEGSVWDLTVSEIHVPIESYRQCPHISRSSRCLPEYRKLFMDNDTWILTPGHYLIKSLETINMPIEMSGLVIPRTSVFRAGLIPTGTRISPGYSGNIVTGLYIPHETPIFSIERGARLMSVSFDTIILPNRVYDWFLERYALSPDETAQAVGKYDGIWSGGKVTTDATERAF